MDDQWDDLNEQKFFIISQIEYMTRALERYKLDLAEIEALIKAQTDPASLESTQTPLAILSLSLPQGSSAPTGSRHHSAFFTHIQPTSAVSMLSALIITGFSPSVKQAAM